MTILITIFIVIVLLALAIYATQFLPIAGTPLSLIQLLLVLIAIVYIVKAAGLL